MKRPAAFFSLIVLAISAACSRKPAEPDVKIGIIAELSGDIAAVGASCKNAAELAVQEINDKGVEIDGVRHGLKLIIADSGGKPELAVEEARKLIDQEDILVLIGPNSSHGAIPVADVAEASQVLMITPWSTNPKTTLDSAGAPRKSVFRVCFTDPFEARVLARFGQGYMHATKAAVLYDAASEAPRSQAELFRKEYEAAGGKVVAFETYNTGDKDFSAQFKKIKDAEPQMVFLPSYYNDVPVQLKQARELGLTAPFLGSDNWSTPDLLKKAGKDAEGAFLCSHYNPKARNEKTGRFVVSYQKKYNKETPDDVAALTYDAFGMLVQAITTAGKLDRAAVRDAMSKMTAYEGVTGKITWKPGSGDPVKPAVMQQVQNGEFLFITNIDPD